MGKLTELSAEQEALLPAIRDRWLRVGLSTEPADRVTAEAGVRLAYERAGLVPPRLVVWLGSPLAGVYGQALLRRDQVRDQVWAQVRGQVRDQVRAQVRDQVEAQVWGQVEAQVRDQVWDQVGDQVWDQVEAQVRAQVWDQVGGQVWDQVRAQVRDQVVDWGSGIVWGSHDYWTMWIATYSHLGIRDADRLDGLIQVAENAGWWWPLDGAVVLTERPCTLHRDPLNRLHAETGNAIEWPDGWGFPVWHGTRLPETPEQIRAWSTDRVLREPNAEVRRAAIEIRGWDQFVTEAGLRLVDETDDPGNPGNMIGLYDVPAAIYETAVRVLLCTNGSPERDGTRRRFGLTVPADLPDALSAAGWGYGLSGPEYALVGRRT